MSRITKALLAMALLALAAPAGATAAPALVPVGDFIDPIYVTAPPRDAARVFVVERAGRIQVVRDGTPLGTPFLDIADDVDTSGERGLLSIAFAGDYEQSGLFYVYMVARDPVGEIQVREYRRSATDPDVADPASGRIVYKARHDEAANHNGGQIEWGPDGMLWFAPGDGGDENDNLGHARDLSSPLGKVLRIDPRPGNRGSYGVPDSNPTFAGRGGPSAVWAYGLRNPFRFSFDRATGDLWIGDVGQDAAEEVNRAPAASGTGRGADYGWACREGTLDGPKPCTPGANYLAPVYDYDSTAGTRSVAGGYVVRDPGLPTLEGRYLFADTFEGVIRSFAPAAPRGTIADADLPTRNLLVSFGEDACGRIYVVSLNGTVERIQDGAPGPCVLKAAPPPGGGPGNRPPAAPDRTSPRLRISVARKGRVGRRATPRIFVTASETSRVTITARLAKTNLKRVRATLRGGRRTVVRLRPKAKAVKKIRRALRRNKRVTMRVRAVAVDAAGNRGRVTKRLKVRRG